MLNVYIATSRDIGKRCKNWAKKHAPKGFRLTDKIEESDIFISVLYDKLISDHFIKKCKACFNFHPGILPEYRGSGAFSWAIINQEKETGITLHLIDRKIDHGNYIDIRTFKITKKDTACSLFKKAEKVIFKMFKFWFLRMLEERYVAYPQDHKKAKLYLRKDLDGARDLTRFVRAFHFPGKLPAHYFDIKGDGHFIFYDPLERNKY